MITITEIPPTIKQFYNNVLLSRCFDLRDDSKVIFKLLNFIKHKISKKRYKKFPNTINKLEKKYQGLLKIYEEILQNEKLQAEKETRASDYWYRIELSDSNSRAIYERLKYRAICSSRHRKNHDI